MSNRPTFTSDQIEWLDNLLTEKTSEIYLAASGIQTIAEILGAGGSEPEVTGDHASGLIDALQALGRMVEQSSANVHCEIVHGRGLRNDY